MTTTTISLNKLFAWDGNVRKTGSRKGSLPDARAIVRIHAAYDIGHRGQHHHVMQALRSLHLR